MKRHCIFLITTLVTVSLTACGSSETSKTNYDKSVVVSNTSELNSQIQKFITGTAPSELSLFNDDIVLDSKDLLVYYEETSRYEVGDNGVYSDINGTTYLSRDAYYYELSNDTYRFQLDLNGNVTSYIHYQKIGE